MRECLEQYFRAERDGLGDNEDMGCQSAFFICSAMGLYPLMGQDLYFLVPPLFQRTTLLLGAKGKEVPLTIEVQGEDGGSGSLYIQSAVLNGQTLDRAWVRHEEIAGGGTLVLELGPDAGKWGRRVPPSPLAEWGQ